MFAKTRQGDVLIRSWPSQIASQYAIMKAARPLALILEKIPLGRKIAGAGVDPKIVQIGQRAITSALLFRFIEIIRAHQRRIDFALDA